MLYYEANAFKNISDIVYPSLLNFEKFNGVIQINCVLIGLDQ